MRERAGSLTRAMEGGSVDAFRVEYARLYDPVREAIQRLRHGDGSGIETLVRFLEADVYCFRSGYTKADVIRALTRADLDDPRTVRLRRVVLIAVEGDDRREFRAYVRLARRLDSPSLRDDLQHLASSSSTRVARHAQWVLEGLDPKP